MRKNAPHLVRDLSFVIPLMIGGIAFLWDWPKNL